MPLIKTARIFTRDDTQISPAGITYTYADEDTGATRSRIVLDDATVADFGDPHELTVTVRPGDHLNTQD